MSEIFVKQRDLDQVCQGPLLPGLTREEREFNKGYSQAAIDLIQAVEDAGIIIMR